MLELRYCGDKIQINKFDSDEEMVITIEESGGTQETVCLCKEQVEILQKYLTDQLNNLSLDIKHIIK